MKVVITTYNRRRWLSEAINSVFGQTYSNLHLVLVDDASSDDTVELVQAVARARPGQVTAIVKPVNRGVGDSICTGIRSGPPSAYVAFLNDDDVWEAEKVAHQVEIFESSSAVSLTYCEARLIDDDGALLDGVYSDEFGKYKLADLDEVLQSARACASTLMMRADVADVAAASMPDEAIAWDNWLLLNAAARGTIRSTGQTDARYRVHAAGLHLTKTTSTRKSITVAREQIFVQNPEIVEHWGGGRKVRLRLATLNLDLIVWALVDRAWREYVWQSVHLLRHRRFRPAFWWAIHSARILLRNRRQW